MIASPRQLASRAGALGPDPKPGIYPGVPFEEYAAIRAMNCSTIKRGQQSPMHLLHALQHPEAWEETEALRFGKLFHMALLEPERYDLEVSREAPINPGTGSPYGFKTQAWRKAEAEMGMMIVSPEWAGSIAAMVANVRAHETAAKLLAGEGQTEVVAVWEDPETGVRCKARVDTRRPGVALLDAKTTENASPEEFQWSTERYGYDIQAAVYTDGWRILTGEDEPFGIIAVEKSPPFGCAVYEIAPAAVARGRAKYRGILRAYVHCRQTGVFPAYPESPVVLDTRNVGPREDFEDNLPPGFQLHPNDPGLFQGDSL